jgi:hypothetical protein
MRKSKTIKIDEKEIDIKELRVKDILEIFDMFGQEGIGDLENQIQTFLPMFTKDISLEDLKSMAPSEINQIVDAAKEVNSYFLSIARRLGLGKLIKDFQEAIMTDFSGLLAGSLKQVMSKSLNTDIPHSSSQPKNNKKQETNESATQPSPLEQEDLQTKTSGSNL